ncbi:hypothetical protein FC093_14225 [Ilyomonas limi]|uniref:Uncharacterized protein n=1 Tax=Ilyomonas limi TaxID=2575867 RepID=A0A4U3KXW3_9BACT|nr:hypothetical protein [Ilyomonas limi]TKK67448.1 hypothetical protein FC093_14225 [Ilyomonas limi]
MITGIPKNYHIIADIGYIPLVWMAPKLFRFEEEKTAATLCQLSSAADVAYSLITDAPWGAVKLISYKTHALIDVAQGVVALTASLALPVRNKRARNTLLAMGVTGLVVGTLSWIGSKRNK